MVSSLVVAYLLGHGFVHMPMWLAPRRRGYRAPHRSWVLAAADLPQARAPAAARLLACTTAALYAIAGAALLVGLADWAIAAVAAAVVGLVLKFFWYSPRLTAGLLLDVAVLVAVAEGWPTLLL
ncbi:hypothetical protein [Streptomyces longispororuber]|uniref:hypothetical protein n=1 Tax=Streptomyces longispororuber TaxID=68230 RepID=UPI00210E0DDF|nr:hypothetical protein [Streptomyces longispororuber]MCQ4205653.1 hypothetical protein [Streptomyces longispororuber]